jgi:hypothetical protein
MSERSKTSKKEEFGKKVKNKCREEKEKEKK